MSARFLVRFDDICPTMNWAVWERVEELLLRHDVKPIVAIVPDNRDPKLAPCAARPDFWDRARGWQRKGWTIGLHGYRHLYEGQSGGIMDVHAGSEFAGVPREVQRERLAAGTKIFAEQELVPAIWVAPGHAFDHATLELLPEVGIRAVSDGFFWRAVNRNGVSWIPQQLWRFRAMPFGLWTVCLHVNNWKEDTLRQFEVALARFAGSLTNVADILAARIPQAGVLDHAFEAAYAQAVRTKFRKREH